jgi:hypothetical protein
MMVAVPPTSPRRRATIVGALMAAAGIVLLAILVWSVGPGQIVEGFSRIGVAGLAVVVALGGLRFAARALAWTLAFEPPHRLSFGDAFNALVCGDTLGNAMVLGPLVSEPAKLAYIRQRVPLGPAITALAIENVLYTLSVAAMIAAGAIALLFAFDLPSWLRGTSELALVAVALGFAVVLWMVWRRPAILSRALPWIARGSGRGVSSRVDGLRAAEQDIYTFASRRRGVIVPLILLELAFHALGVLEMHATLWMLQGGPQPLIFAFVLEAASRLITVALKFVPYQTGGSEVGLAGVTQILGLGTIGLTASLVRKVRMLTWSLYGAALLVRRGLTTRRILEDETLQLR